MNDRKVYWAHEVPKEIVKAISNAKMNLKHEKLNHLLKEDAMSSLNARGRKR